MSSSFYIRRTLMDKDQAFTDAELITKAKCLVILAEPGAGKSELLKYFGRRLGTTVQRASIFRHKAVPSSDKIFILDGLDELAKVDESAIEALVAKLAEAAPEKIIVASRASEWNQRRFDGLVKDTLGFDVQTARLIGFDKSEQKKFFQKEFSQDDFENFLKKVEAFDLDQLLENPMFLKIFGVAYTQNEGTFDSKERIFSDAISGLAKEHNLQQPKANRLTSSEVIKCAEEVFAKLMLSGASGVTTTDILSDRDYPLIDSLLVDCPKTVSGVIDNRLFKIGTEPDKFEPVHRIISEYCAAKYLAQRIKNKADPLSINACVSLIAPNKTVRDELRGLLGWLAAFGDFNTQKTLISLDPYGVLANGDASRLSKEAKRFLLENLKHLSDKDPFFRRSDRLRRFNIAGFFDQGIASEVKAILSHFDEQVHLGGLLLELLYSSKSAAEFEGDLERILLDSSVGFSWRQLVLRTLLNNDCWEYSRCLERLSQEASQDSLKLAGDCVAKIDQNTLTFGGAVNFLDGAIRYLDNSAEGEMSYRPTSFMDGMLSNFGLKLTEKLLDQYTANLKCECSAETDFGCDCRTGKSKICGRLLDHHADLSNLDVSASKIWEWTRNLNFIRGTSDDCSKSTARLRSDNLKRQKIQILAFSNLSEKERIYQLKRRFVAGCAHAGLQFQKADWLNIIIYAFENKNYPLWECFHRNHNFYSKQEGVDLLRTTLRQQANQDANCMRIWSLNNRNSENYFQEHRFRRSRRQNKYASRQAKIVEKNLEHLNDNYELVKSGNHWWWVEAFARDYLNKPENLTRYTDFLSEPDFPEIVLRNSIPMLEEHLPTMDELVELHCSSRYSSVLVALYAACLATYRETGSLQEISQSSLKALRTEYYLHCDAIEEGERESFLAELDRILLESEEDASLFAHEYIVPQLARPGNHHTKVWWINSDPKFQHLRESHSLVWLEKYPDMPISALVDIFGFAVEFGNREQLTKLISARCEKIQSLRCYGPPTKKLHQQIDFWFIRSFFFVDENNNSVWEEIKENPDTLLKIKSCQGEFRGEALTGWPEISAAKIFKIYDTFVDVWPKVHLPSSWGSGDPKDQVAYRFLTNLIFKLEAIEPAESIPVYQKMLNSSRFEDFHSGIKHQKAGAERKLSLRDFTAPSPKSVCTFLDSNSFATVESLRALLIDELNNIQKDLKGASTDPIQVFYAKNERVDENTARNRIIEKLAPRFNGLDVILTPEEHMASSKRCDITANTSIEGTNVKLVVEVKGQWNSELFRAASAQLYERYSIHPEAARQGVYLVLWYGHHEKVAGLKNVEYATPEKLKSKLEDEMPEDLRPRIDVFVLDLSLPENS